ncbi:MAG: YceH family protein [Syntrophomonadaceae bacterium]
MEILNQAEVRVLGSLIEKEFSTPEYYPLTLNALVNACNQKSSREPVVSYDEAEVKQALSSLREKRLVRLVEDTGRAAKYKETFMEELSLSLKETAVLCILMLRGSQTPGEIKGRSARIFNFQSLEETEEVLQGLIDRPENALAAKLERQPGMKERRYSHLLSGAPELSEVTADNQGPGMEEKLLRLESEVENLKAEIEELKAAFALFKKQFE